MYTHKNTYNNQQQTNNTKDTKQHTNVRVAMPHIQSYMVTEPFLFLTPPQVIAPSLQINGRRKEFQDVMSPLDR